MMRFFRDFKQLIPVTLYYIQGAHLQQMFLFKSIYLYSNLCPFNLKYYVGDKVTKKMMKRVAGRVELSERAVMIFHVVCKYTHTQTEKTLVTLYIKVLVITIN